MVEITPEIQAQLDEQKKQCIFCKILKGEQESKPVYDDELIKGILDINPAIQGHVLLLPKEHYPIMPFLPPETFKHLFGKMPKLVGAVKSAFLCTGANVFIANGGIAGQQSPHWIVHLMPREKGDSLDKFSLDKQIHFDEEKSKQTTEMLAKNIPIMMGNHFQRNPAEWHKGKGEQADHLKDVGTVVYEDEKSLVVVPEKPQALGHLVIHSKEEQSEFENLDEVSASHLFFVASFCATAVFEGLGAQGSNIILKTGMSNDNLDGSLSIHVLPRSEDDGLDFMWKPMEPKPNLDQVASKIKDKTFVIEHESKGPPKLEVIDVDAMTKKEVKVEEKKEPSGLSEVEEAIRKLKQ